MDGWRLLTTIDPAERLTLIAVAMEATKARAQMDPWTDTKEGG